MEVRIAEGEEARRILKSLGVPESKTRCVYSLRVAIDGDSFKLKVNEGAWSPPYGGRQQRR